MHHRPFHPALPWCRPAGEVRIVCGEGREEQAGQGGDKEGMDVAHMEGKL